MAVNILGAGLSGLSAAINLVKGGECVTVFERREAAGLQVKQSFQALRCILVAVSLSSPS